MLVVPPLVFFGIALAVIAVPLPAGFPPAFAKSRSAVAAAVVGPVAAVWMVVFVVYVVRSFLNAGAGMDGAFAARGFAAERYMGFGRRYRGIVDGRTVDVTFVPARASQTPVLQIGVTASATASMAVGRGRPLLSCRDCAQIAAPYPEFSGLDLYASDPAWAARLLAAPTVRSAIARQFDPAVFGGSTEFYVEPDRILLYVRSSSVSPDASLAAARDLAQLAHACEAP